MNLRSCLLASLALTVGVFSCNNRDPLAPYDSLGNNCAEIIDGRVGVEYSFQVEARGGVAPFTWDASGLPDGLSIDPDTGLISGIPTEAGTFEVTVTVTDATGYRVDVTCGDIVIEDAFTFDCDQNAFPDAASGGNYTHTFSAVGGTEPYVWSSDALPADLTLDPNTGVVSGTVNVPPGDYAVTVFVTDSSSPTVTQSCDLVLTVNEGLQVDPNPLEDLAAYPNCVPVNSGIDVDQLVADGIIFGGDGTPLTCYFDAFMNNQGQLGNGNLPVGINVDERCVATGTVTAAQPIGAYVWIMNVLQETTGQEVHIPYCATQEVPHPNAYNIVSNSGGNDVTFTPGYTPLNPVNGQISFGSAMDPRVDVTRPCNDNFCFHAYYFTFNVFDPAQGPISAEPSTQIMGGGFSHAIQVNYTAPESLQDRFWVANVKWDYCLFGSDAANQVDADAEFAARCGDKGLAQQNGDDSNLEFGLIVRPPDP